MTDRALPDFAALRRRVAQMHHDVAAAQDGITDVQATGMGGNGLVIATLGGDGRLLDLRIDPSVIDPADARGLGELIIEAVDEAGALLAARRAERVNELTGGLADAVAAMRAAATSGPPLRPRVVRDPAVGVSSAAAPVPVTRPILEER
jgi:nucleoid-associated protein EbfC